MQKRFSVVIPTRDATYTLRSTLQTCLAQDFEDCEIIVSDNQSSPATRQVVDDLADHRLKYVRTPHLLAMTDSWEFAVAQASGEYVTLLGDNDGLLLHALPEIDRIIRMLDTKILRWESVCYNWPDLPVQEYASANELLIPLKQTNYYHPIRRRTSNRMIPAVLNSPNSYAQLPMIYASAIHHSLIARLRDHNGRVFRSQYPDVYSGFAFAHLAGTYHSVDAPMNINALSGKSTGFACFYLKERSPIAREFRTLNSQANLTRHPWIPDLPLMAVAVADAFLHAKEALFPDERACALDRKQMMISCIKELRVADDEEWRKAREVMRQTLVDDTRLLAWFDVEYGNRSLASLNRTNQRSVLKRYGGTYLHLDAAELGVSDVFGAAQLCEKLLGYKLDGVNAHPKSRVPRLVRGLRRPLLSLARALVRRSHVENR
jgi:glycosyltransferase involved in cell wall biosynthesis